MSDAKPSKSSKPAAAVPEKKSKAASAAAAVSAGVAAAKSPSSSLSASSGGTISLSGAANHPDANVVKSKKSTSGFAIVKAVQSGDTLILMGAQPAGSAALPPERMISISGIQAPRCARSKNQGADEPYGWESREFLRKKVIGQTVQFDVSNVLDSGREYGKILLNGENLAHIIVRAGWAAVKQPAVQKENARIPPEREELLRYENDAKAEGAGLHSRVSKSEDHIRSVDWIPNPKEFFNTYKNIPLPAIIDDVRSGSTVKVEILNPNKPLSSTILLILLAGVQCPRVPLPLNFQIEQWKKRKEEDPSYDADMPSIEDSKPEPFALEALHFVESRLMNRDVQVVLQGADKFGNLFATIQFPKGNITLKLLELGYGKFIPWSAALTATAEQFKNAEAAAKRAHLRLWHNYSESGPLSPTSDGDPSSSSSSSSSEPLPKEWTGKLVQIIQPDTLIIEDAKDVPRKIYLSSIRAPKLGNSRRGDGDEACAFEAREAIRSKFIGKKVKVAMDYTRSAPAEAADQSIRQYASVTYQKANLAETLVSSGLASVLRHRVDEDRSAFYDTYLAAEEAASKATKGIHKKDAKTQRFVDLSERFVKKPVAKKSVGDEEADDAKKDEDEGSSAASNKQKALSQKAKQYLGLLSRDKSLQAVVEHVFSGTRFKLFIPSQNIYLAFVLSGIKGPPQKNDDGSNNPISDQALQYVRSRILQHDVRVEVETLDRADNYVGNLFWEHRPLSVWLLEEGFANVFQFSADKSAYRQQLMDAEAAAKAAKKGVWVNYVEPTPEERAKAAAAAGENHGDGDEKDSKKSGDRPVKVTEVIDANNFFIQFQDDSALQTLSKQLNDLFSGSLPSEDFVPSARGGQLCAGLWEEGSWLRVRLEGRGSYEGVYRVVFIDFGNSDELEVENLRALPDDLAKIHPLAHNATLSAIKAPVNADYRDDAAQAFADMVMEGESELLARVDWIDHTRKYHVTLLDAKSSEYSVNRALVRDGWARVSNRVDRRLTGVAEELKKEQQEAKSERLGVFEYGDVSDDEEEDRDKPFVKRPTKP